MNAGPRPLLRVSSHDPLSSYLFIYLFRLSLDWIFRGGKNKKITKYREFKSNLFGLIKIIGNKFLNVEEEITSRLRLFEVWVSNYNKMFNFRKSKGFILYIESRRLISEYDVLVEQTRVRASVRGYA